MRAAASLSTGVRSLKRGTDDLVPRILSARLHVRLPPHKHSVDADSGRTKQSTELCWPIHVEGHPVDRAVRIADFMAGTPAAEPAADGRSARVDGGPQLVGREPVGVVKIEQCSPAWPEDLPKAAQGTEVIRPAAESQAVPEHDGDIEQPSEHANVPLIQGNPVQAWSSSTGSAKRLDARVDACDLIAARRERNGCPPITTAHIEQSWIACRWRQLGDSSDLPRCG